MSLITLTTDFGLGDWFVGAIKGVILGINPRVRIIDITHEIQRGDIRGAAFALSASFRFFPPQTIHVSVVDPGVGSNRGAIAVTTKDYYFVGPDNGVLSLALNEERIQAIRRIENPKFLLRSISQTFHGRDVFAPVAAHLSKGAPFESLGAEQTNITRVSWPQPKWDRKNLIGEIIYFDHFGNAITNIGPEHLKETKPCSIVMRLPRAKRALPIGSFYEAVKNGSALVLLGSTGFFEIAVNGGNAADVLKLKLGDRVVLCSAGSQHSLRNPDTQAIT